jgi:hypothetical protein
MREVPDIAEFIIGPAEGRTRWLIGTTLAVQKLSCLTHGVHSSPWVIAVGTLIAERPPHRSVRAQLRHTAPTSGV